MAPAREAITAAPADHMPFAADKFSGMEVVNVRANLDDFSDELMPNHQRNGNGLLRPLIPVIYVDISATNAGKEHPNFDVVDSDLRLRNIFEPQACFLAAFDQSFHSAHFLPAARTHKHIGRTVALFAPERRLTASLVSS